MKIHIVQKGDTLWKIAKKYGVNFEELKQLNTQLSNPDMIMPGMKIKVPTSGGNIKKETQTGAGGAKINLGSKKEAPIKEQAIKEMPTVPKKEAPIIKEQPIKEIPKPAPIIKEKPVEKPKEAPKKPYIPKMPQPIIPEIDINNYFMMNMANMNVQKPAPVPPNIPPIPPIVQPTVEKKQPMKELPITKKPMKEIPKAKAPTAKAPTAKAPTAKVPAKGISKTEAVEKKMPFQKSTKKDFVLNEEVPKQPIAGVGGEFQPIQQQPMHSYMPQVNLAFNPCAPLFSPYQDPCYPGAQAMPYMQGAHMPPVQGMPYPQVQGAYMPQMQGAPYPDVQGAFMPPVQGMPYPPVQGAYMPQMGAPCPDVQGAFMPPVQGMPYPQMQGAPYEDVQGSYLPTQPMPFPEVQGSYQPEFPTPDGSVFPPNLMPGVANEGILEESSPFYGFDPNVAGAGFNQEPYYGAPMNPEQMNAQVQGVGMGGQQPHFPTGVPIQPPTGFSPYQQKKNDYGFGVQPGYQQPLHGYEGFTPSPQGYGLEGGYVPSPQGYGFNDGHGFAPFGYGGAPGGSPLPHGYHGGHAPASPFSPGAGYGGGPVQPFIPGGAESFGYPGMSGHRDESDESFE